MKKLSERLGRDTKSHQKMVKPVIKETVNENEDVSKEDMVKALISLGDEEKEILGIKDENADTLGEKTDIQVSNLYKKIEALDKESEGEEKVDEGYSFDSLTKDQQDVVGPLIDIKEKLESVLNDARQLVRVSGRKWEHSAGFDALADRLENLIHGDPGSFGNHGVQDYINRVYQENE